MTQQNDAVKISELNAIALAADLQDLRRTVMAQGLAMDHIRKELATTRALLQKQGQVIGETLQKMHGGGPTEVDRS